MITYQVDKLRRQLLFGSLGVVVMENAASPKILFQRQEDRLGRIAANYASVILEDTPYQKHKLEHRD